MESRITKIENYLKTIVELIEDIKDLMNKTIVDSRNTKNLLIEANRIIQSSNKPNKIIKSAKHKAKRQFDLIIYQIKKLKKEIETLSNNNIDLNNLLPQIYKKYGINEINVNLLNVTKSLNFFIYQFTEIKSKLKYENFNFNGIISEINKIKIEDNYYLIPSVFENLLKIITDIYNNKEKISKEIYEKDILILDVTKEFQDFSDAKNIISIIDADFIASLQKLT